MEQNVQELAKTKNLEELHKHQDKFIFEEFTQLELAQLELAITLEMSDMQEEFYRERFKQGVNVILSMQK